MVFWPFEKIQSLRRKKNRHFKRYGKRGALRCQEMQEKEAPPKAIAPEVGSVEKEPAEEEEKKPGKEEENERNEKRHERKDEDRRDRRDEKRDRRERDDDRRERRDRRDDEKTGKRKDRDDREERREKKDKKEKKEKDDEKKAKKTKYAWLLEFDSNSNDTVSRKVFMKCFEVRSIKRAETFWKQFEFEWFRISSQTQFRVSCIFLPFHGYHGMS